MNEASVLVELNSAQSRRQRQPLDPASVPLERKYTSLGETARRVLRHLSVFVGEFTAEAAYAVVVGAGLPRAGVSAGITALLASSLLERRGVRYVLCLPVRAFARRRLVCDGELDLVARNHAQYLQCVLEFAEVEFDRREPQRWMAHYASLLDDVRSALDWAFAPSGDPTMGIDLTVAAIPLWLSSSQADELHRRIGRALKSEAATTHSGREMRLRTAARLAGMSDF
jgi:predicted ATPase